MTVLYSVDIKGAFESSREFDRIDRDLSGRRLEDAWTEAVELVGGGVRELGPRDLGDLIASIEEEVIIGEREFTGIIYSDMEYAPYQERGTDPYFPNFEALEEWAERHGTTAWVVALAISRQGVPAREYFKGSLQEHQTGVFNLIGGAVGTVIEREY